ncbi:MAG: GGDEF domain-containing protein [Candidatus Dormibacteraeota bacterium]|nr:GGDEF domain-containing protein [Candidatus Dormibacteraeota bacterium]
MPRLVPQLPAQRSVVTVQRPVPGPPPVARPAALGTRGRGATQGQADLLAAVRDDDASASDQSTATEGLGTSFDAGGSLDVRRFAYLGAAFTALTAMAAAVYLLSTPHGSHRLLLDVLCLAAVVSAGVVVLAARRLVGTPREAVFFYGWSATAFAFIIVAAALDGVGPLAWLLVLPVAYASISYPLVAVRWIANVSQAGALFLMAVSNDWGGTGWYRFLFVATFNVLAISSAQNRHLHAEARRLLAIKATHDDLTGCLSHGSYFERLDCECARVRRQGGSLTFVMVDVDHLKLVNDGHGHQAGDHVLRAVGTALRKGARSSDAVGRLGGDEFGVILVDSDPTPATEWTDRFRVRLQQPGNGPRVTVSMGVATWTGPDDSASALARRADIALYEAKKAGRDRVVVSPGQPPRTADTEPGPLPLSGSSSGP